MVFSVDSVYLLSVAEYRDPSHRSHQQLDGTECIPASASHHRAAITDLIITISLTNGGCSLAKPDRDKLVPSSTETPSIRQRRGEESADGRGAVVCFGGRVPSGGRVVFVLVACLILPSILYPCLTGIM